MGVTNDLDAGANDGALADDDVAGDLGCRKKDGRLRNRSAGLPR